MAKIGIVCEGYKVEMFKKELDAIGVFYDINNFNETGTIVIITVYSEQYIIRPIVDKVTQYWIDYFKAHKTSNLN